MNWEISLLQYLQSIRSDFLSLAFQIITASVEMGLLLIIIGITYWCINKEFGKKIAFIMLFSGFTNGLVKNIVKASRPFELGIVEPIRKHTATGYSFPSGHTQSGATFWIVIMQHFKKAWLYYTGTVIMILVAISRLYLGVHWPKDVIVGLILALIASYIGNKIYPYVLNSKIGVIITISTLIGSVLIFNVDDDYIKLVGAMIGFMLGILAEEKYVRFTTDISFKKQVYRVLLGFTSVLLVWIILKIILPQVIIFKFISYIMIVFWVVAGAPYLFKKFT